MEMQNKPIDFICNATEIYPQLCHALYLKKQYDKGTLNDKNFECALLTKYIEYLKYMLSMDGEDKISIFKKVDYLNSYYYVIHDNQTKGVLSTQGQLRSSVLEEFLFLLYKNHIEVLNKINLQNYNKYNLGCNNILINQVTSLHLPHITIIKTIVNMNRKNLDSIIATAEKIKSGNPHTRFIAVAERYDVSFSVDPAYSRIDQIYVLRKSMRKNEWKDIDKDVVWRMFDETISHLNRPWSDVESRIKNDGVII